jgi:hypothetical protein
MLSVAALSLCRLCIPLPGIANRIGNGSFEVSVTHPSNWITFSAGSMDISGWVVSQDNIDLKGGYWVAAEGQQSLDLDGTFAFGAIAQSFSTLSGQLYRVSLSMAGNPDACGTRHMRVSAAKLKRRFQLRFLWTILRRNGLED